MTPARCSPQEFLWEKQGSPAPLNKGPDSILLIPSFNATHVGTYTCTVTSSQGRAVATYSLWTNGRDGTEGTAGHTEPPAAHPHHCLSPCATAPGPDAGAATSVLSLPDLRSSVFVFPQESQTAHVQVTLELQLPLNNFSVCLRSFTDLTRSYSLFSYATKEQSNEILLFKPKPGQYELTVGDKSLYFTVPISLGESEHVCFSWESSTGIVRFWFNGKPWPRKGLQKGYTVGVPAYIVLGQDQDSFGGSFDAQQSFVGEISSVYMWDMGISNSGVLSAMYDSPYQTPLFGWRNFPYKIVDEVYLKP